MKTTQRAMPTRLAKAPTKRAGRQGFIAPLLIIIIAVLLVGGYVYRQKQLKTNASAINAATETTQTTQISLATLNGHIDTKEIGGEDLTIHSQDNEIAQADSNVDFTLKLSGTVPQILAVQDDKKDLRATAIYLPGNTNIVINANSTAKASVAHSGALLISKDLKKIESDIGKIENSVCLPELTLYLKKKLKTTGLGLNGLNQKEEYTTLVARCVTEIHR